MLLLRFSSSVLLILSESLISHVVLFLFDHILCCLRFDCREIVISQEGVEGWIRKRDC